MQKMVLCALLATDAQRTGQWESATKTPQSYTRFVLNPGRQRLGCVCSWEHDRNTVDPPLRCAGPTAVVDIAPSSMSEAEVKAALCCV